MTEEQIDKSWHWISAFHEWYDSMIQLQELVKDNIRKDMKKENEIRDNR